MACRLTYLFVGLTAVMSVFSARASSDCSYDRDGLMALDEHSFDQDLTGGWRKLANTADCQTVAADLIRDYRNANEITSGILYWHEGQLRAMVNDYDNAITLLDKSRKPAMEDLAGWNLYVDATIAFLQKDVAALEQARQSLSTLQPSGELEVQDGFLLIHGQRSRIRWPMNLDVVEGLRNCFWKSYSDAYGTACRNPSN